MIFKNLFFQIVLAFIIAIFCISNFFSGNAKFENEALGTETLPYQAVNKSNQAIHIQKISEEEFLPFLSDYKKRGEKQSIFFMGNSQTHSINQKKTGQINYIEILNNKYFNTNTEILCYSMPNANLQEFYLAYSFFKDKIKINELVVPLFFDDLREEGIRDVFFPYIIKKHFLLDSFNLMNKKLNQQLVSYWRSYSETTTNHLKDDQDILALKETVQENVEKKINRVLEDNIAAWNNRSNVRGSFFIWLYQFRNTILGIKASTIRKMIPQRYDNNMNALNLILDDCKKNNIKVLLYIPPIRSDVNIPYEKNSYEKFKNEIITLTNSNSDFIKFANLEKIIPGNLWGYKSPTNLLEKREVDYMHFQFHGHEILADSLSNYLQINKK